MNIQNEWVQVMLAFLEGLALIASPCILPILPIILSGSIEGKKSRPFGIIIGFVFAFIALTLFSRTLVQISGINLNYVRYFSYGLLFIFSLIMISNVLSEKFSILTQRLLSTGSSYSSVNNAQGGFVSGLLFGSLVGLIWTPCAGPILAVVIVQTALQQADLMSYFIVFAFGVGAGLPMFLIAWFGRALVSHLSFIKNNAYLLRKILGYIILASVALMIHGEIYSQGISNSMDTHAAFKSSLVNALKKPYAAPEISGISDWINSNPLQVSQLKNKVILIDFWTYSCINCIRTLPYIKNWYAKYHDKGLVIIGIHTPEFEFEKDVNNVKKGVLKFDIQYPVALDNQYKTWRNFQNAYWPAHYLIDKNGQVVYQHFGEGDYDATENNIRYLLDIHAKPEKTIPETHGLSFFLTPETYLGSARAANFSSPEGLNSNQVITYSYPSALSNNNWALQGKWQIERETIIAKEQNARLKIHFSAKNVYMVMGNQTNQAIKANLFLNGEPLLNNKGKDVINAAILVKDHRLYDVVNLSSTDTGTLEVVADQPGLEIYTFTFG